MNRAIKTVATAVALVALSTPLMSQAAVKASQVAENKVVVTYDLYDLRSNVGRERISREIRQAAKLVCGVDDYKKTRSLALISAGKTCYRNAVSDALSNLDNSGRLAVTAR